MDGDTLLELYEEVVAQAVIEDATTSESSFVQFVEDYLPATLLDEISALTGGGNDFIRDRWEEDFSAAHGTAVDTADPHDLIEYGCCLVCERRPNKMTKHHVFPKETHRTLQKQGYTTAQLSTTIGVCKMCHATIHRFFTNDELSQSYYTLDLLLGDEKFFKYAKWAALTKGSKKVR